MPTFSDLASLLQLGAGVGIGLTFFSAPVERRLRELHIRLDSELGAIDKLTSANAEARRRKIYRLKLKAKACEREVRSRMERLLIVPILGSCLNVSSLVMCLVWSSDKLTPGWFAFAIMQTVLLYPAFFLALKLISLDLILPVEKSLAAELDVPNT